MFLIFNKKQHNLALYDEFMKKLPFFCLIVLIGLISCNDPKEEIDKQTIDTLDILKPDSLYVHPDVEIKNFHSQIIPIPSKVEIQKKGLLLNPNIKIYSDDIFGDISDQTRMIQTFVEGHFENADKGNSIAFIIKSKPTLGAECYELSVNNNGISLYASTKKGIFYGIQTFFQLFLTMTDNQLPYLSIEDCPRFPHRGLMIDPARHFIPIDDIKSFIDIMSFYKFNKLHIHLSDDDGWRVEIKGLPELNCKEGSSSRVFGDKNGRYTQEELIDLVNYAAARAVEIVPEIDIPGHSSYIVSIYPEMICGGSAPKHLQLCASNDKVLDFMDIVISELAEIFPSPNFHLGGDEVPVETIKDCPLCQEKMKQLGYSKEEQLISDLLKNTSKILEKHQKNPMFWFEFNISDYPDNSTVYSWRKERSPEAISIAQNRGYKLICSPDEYSYFNYPQAWEGEPPFDNWGMPAITLYSVYHFDPTFKLSSQQTSNITGIEALLWAEYITSMDLLFYMAYPRAIAFSEVGWSKPENKKWNTFYPKLKHHLNYLSQKGINHRIPTEH